MSNTPKRLNEDANYPAGSKRPLDDRSVTTGVSGKFTQSMSSESQQPLEGGLDGRLAKVLRIEMRDVDKRSPMLTMYKTPSSVDPSSDKPHSMEARQELRDSKESRDAKVDTREVKPEHKDLHTEARTEAQGDKVKDTLRNERESKVEKVSHGDYKSENKNERDGQILGSSHFNLNEAKEQHHRGKKYFEPSSNALDASWVPKNDIQEDNRKDQPLLAREELENAETGEAVGENKVDSKGEEKFKEKERKKKDEWKDNKHNDWGERDTSRTDRRSSFPVSGNINAERRESTREDRESDRWERERKDVKDKESMKDKEKDNNKSESANANQKDVLQSEKEIISEQETLEHRRLKEREKDAKERKSEKDVDVDRGKPGKRAGSYDKESDDGCNEGGDGSSEKDKEGFGCNVQQRKRMLRPRGMSQSSCREARFKARARENEGCQGKSDACDIVYKPGECMQELAKLQKESEASQENESNERPQNGSTLDVRIPAEYVTATNRQVRGGQLWGTDVYTDDSDLVAVLMHTGYCRPTASPPPSAIQELRVTIRVLPPQDSYTSSLRNNVRSRAWGAAIGGSYCVERCCIVKKRGGTIDLEPCLTHVSAVEPTIAPVAIERTMTTRAAASHALRQQRFVREVTVQYNLCNEPWLKYSIGMVADKGLKKAAFTSARLKKGEVLYLETHRNRFELCFNGERAMSNGLVGTSQTAELESQKLQNHNSHDKYHGDRDNVIDVFRWSRCKRPLPQYVVKSIGIPLPVKELEVLEENLIWEDIQWSSTSVWISEKEYVLARAHFMAPN